MAHETSALGRLYRLLADYEALSADPGGTIRDVWSLALGVPGERVALELAKLGAELIPAVEAQLDAADDRHHNALWNKHEHEWTAPILHPTTSIDKQAHELPANNIMYLASLWRGIHSAGIVEGRLPSQEQVRTLIDDLQEVRSKVEKDESLPPSVRYAMARRVTDLIDAFANLTLTGPAGAQAAASRILGDLTIAESVQREPNEVLRTIGRLAYAGYLLVAPLGDFVESAAMIGSGVETVASYVVERADAVVQLPTGSVQSAAVTDGSERPRCQTAR